MNLSYTQDEARAYSLSYSRKFKRPAFWELDPFRTYIDEYSYVEGNPFLQPSINDLFEFQFVYKNFLITKAIFANTQDGFTQIPKVNISTKQRIYTRDNFYNKKQFGLQEILIFTPLSWWETQNVLSLSYLETNLTKNVVRMNDRVGYVGAMFKSNNYFYLNKAKSITLGVDFYAATKSKELYYEIEAMHSLDIDLSVLFFDKKLYIDVFMNDIFAGATSRALLKTNGVTQYAHIDNLTQRVGILASYTFGNKKVRVNRKQQGNEQEKNRSKQ